MWQCVSPWGLFIFDDVYISLSEMRIAVNQPVGSRVKGNIANLSNRSGE
jgi:hypothetical protein